MPFGVNDGQSSNFRIMLKVIQVLVTLILINTNLSNAQSCSSGSSDTNFVEGIFSFFELLSSLSKTDREPRPRNINKAPVIRTEKNEFFWGISVMIPENRIAPSNMGSGGSTGFLWRVAEKSKLWLGGELGYHHIGTEKLDTLNGEYEQIRSNSSIASFNFISKYRFFESKSVQSYIKLIAGLSEYRTATFLYDTEYESCKEYEERSELTDLVTTRKNIGVSLGLQMSLGNFFDRLFIELSHYPGSRTTYVNGEDIHIRPNHVNYSPTTSVLSYISPQIGFSHYF